MSRSDFIGPRARGPLLESRLPAPLARRRRDREVRGAGRAHPRLDHKKVNWLNLSIKLNTRTFSRVPRQTVAFESLFTLATVPLTPPTS